MSTTLTAAQIRKVNQESPVFKDALMGQAVADLQATATALTAPTAGIWLTGALVASDAAAGVIGLLNPYGVALTVVRMVLRVTTIATGTCTLDVGVAATAISNNTLLTALDVNAATGVFDNITNKGASGKSIVLWPATGFLTATKATGATAGLVGTYAVEVLAI